MTRIAVLGDLSGWVNPLLKALEELGVVWSDSPNKFIEHWPEDLHVVQVGDLVHKGKDSTVIVSLVDEALRNDDVNWTQLFGNHESQYLPISAPVFWDNLIDVDAYKTLLGWFEDDLIHPSCAITTRGGEQYLVTHAGLPLVTWADDFMLMSPPSITRVLNSAPDSSLVVAPGMMLEGGSPEQKPGVIWTEGAYELRAPWQIYCEKNGVSLPFNQIHGHSQGLYYDRFKKRWIVPSALKNTTTVDSNGHNITTIPTGGRIVGIDPGSTSKHQSDLIPLVLDGVVTV